MATDFNRYNSEYKKTHYKSFMVRIPKREKDLLAWVSSLESRNRAVIEGLRLLREKQEGTAEAR